MTAVELDDSWKKKALSRIESFRKSSLTLNVKSFSGNYHNLTLEVGLRLNSCVHAVTWRVTLFYELLLLCSQYSGHVLLLTFGNLWNLIGQNNEINLIPLARAWFEIRSTSILNHMGHYETYKQQFIRKN